MATSIHHGAPGSFKSFTLVQRFAIPALIEGRAVVTNIRGFDDIDRVREQFPEKEFSENARIIWVDTTVQSGRTKMASWFHWAPFGALIIIDEVQQVYPDRRDFKLESLDKYVPVHGEIIEDIGLPEGRPEDVFTAYDKQRHYNWDIFCSTPNIAKVKKEIREVSEWAFRHRNLSGVLPWFKNTWTEHQHDPETSGKSLSHVVGSPTRYKADKRVFACYASTATGLHVESKAGRSIFQDRKILFFLGVIVCSLSYSIYSFRNSSFIKADTPDSVVPVPVASPPVVPTRPDDIDRRIDVLPASRSALDGNLVPLRLTRSRVLYWSVMGVDKLDLPYLPHFCNVSYSAVSCVLTAGINSGLSNSSVVVSSSNRACYPVGTHIVCKLIFAINSSKVEESVKVPTLASVSPYKF